MSVIVTSPIHSQVEGATVTSSESWTAKQTEHDKPVVIVGNGPVGMKAVAEILNRDRSIPVVIYGEESHPPYDRVKLSSWLIGDVDRDSIDTHFRRPFGSALHERFGMRVVAIDRNAKLITDASGLQTQYEKLILATGSHAFIPDIKGITLNGVFKLRTMDDATRLFARQYRSRHTLVIGGGLLGIETARGMRKNNTKITIVENTSHLMSGQFDETAANIICNQLQAIGLDVLVGSGVKEILGTSGYNDSRVKGVILHSGKTIECDTVIVATGIRPNLALAKQAGLHFGRGITVDNQLRTSDPDIYAIGECAEHNGQVYGLVAPGFEHAAAVANNIVGDTGEYLGSLSAARLKIASMNVFSASPAPNEPVPLYERFISYHDKENQTYRRLQLSRGRLIGAIGIGEWEQSLRVQSAIGMRNRIWPWHKLRFRVTGDLWPKQSANAIGAWPANTIVCQCNNINKGRIESAIASGCQSVDAIGKTCGAGMVCGSCKPQLATLLGKPSSLTVGGYKRLVGFALIALLMTAVMLFANPIAYVASVQNPQLMGLAINWHWDSLWRDGLMKQISGFTIVGAVVLALSVSLRKRVKRLHSIGQFDGWRIAHLVFSVIGLMALFAHTGFRMGHGLNFVLMSLFIALIIIGIVTTLAMTIGASRAPGFAAAVKSFALNLHIFLFWPIPLLLSWHILKGYWY